MAVLRVYTGAAWDVAIGKTYNGTAWEDQMHYYNGAEFIPFYPDGPVVSPSSDSENNSNTDATCYAGVEFNLSGQEKGRHFSTGTYSVARGDWLDSGQNTEVWVERTINSGSLNGGDPGAGRLILSTTRSYGVQQTSLGSQPCNVTFKFYDAASGGNQIGESTVAMSALYLSGA